MDRTTWDVLFFFLYFGPPTINKGSYLILGLLFIKSIYKISTCQWQIVMRKNDFWKPKTIIEFQLLQMISLGFILFSEFVSKFEMVVMKISIAEGHWILAQSVQVKYFRVCIIRKKQNKKMNISTIMANTQNLEYWTWQDLVNELNRWMI